jgi:hypothetical protein
MPIVALILFCIIGIKTPLWCQVILLACSLLILWYKCTKADRLWVDIEAPLFMAMAMIVYIFASIW